MKKPVYLFLATGFEEIEVVTTVDILRRAELETIIVSVSGMLPVTGAHGITVQADVPIQNVADKGAAAAMLILPGGMPGALNLANNPPLRQIIEQAHTAGVPLSAICAAPMVYGRMGLLKGVRATCYPSFEAELTGATLLEQPVVIDGQFTTGRGPGVTIDFALALVERLVGKEKVETLKTQMMCC